MKTPIVSKEDFFSYSIEYRVIKGEYRVIKGECRVIKGEYRVIKGEYRVIKSEYRVIKVDYQGPSWPTILGRSDFSLQEN